MPLAGCHLDVLSAAALRAALAGLPADVAAAGGSASVRFATAGLTRDRVIAGDPADVVILPPATLAELAERSLVVPASRRDLGATRLGLAVRAAAQRPAIDTADAVVAAFEQAASVGLADPAGGATTGIYLVGLLDRLGLSGRLAGRLRLYPNGDAAMAALGRGEVALAASQVSEMIGVPGVDPIGPLPEALQLRTIYAAAITAAAAAPRAAWALLDRLTSPAMRQVLSAHGFDPP